MMMMIRTMKTTLKKDRDERHTHTLFVRQTDTYRWIQTRIKRNGTDCRIETNYHRTQ